MNNTNPNIKELRGYVMLMLERSLGIDIDAKDINTNSNVD
jgi:hypothetical protein